MCPRRAQRSALLVWTLAFATGCASFPPPPAPVGATGPTAPGLASDPIAPFQLRPGDRIRVELAGESAREVEGLVVDARGQVHVPGLGDVAVGDQSLGDASESITRVLKRLEPFADADVQLEDGAGQQATVLGAVKKQGQVPLTPGMRVADLIAGAGGVLTVTAAGGRTVPMADLAAARLVRSGQPLPLDLERAIEGDPHHNVHVHPGDHLFVPPIETGMLSVLGQVGAPSVLPHWRGARLTEVLAAAGGVTTGADKSDIRVVRGTIEAPHVYQADLQAIVDGEAPDVALLPGDLLFVTDDPIEDFGEILGAFAPVVGLAGTVLLTSLLLSR